MSKRKRGATTATGIEGGVASTDDGSNGAVCREKRGAGFHIDHLHAPDGRTYLLAKDRITPARAQELLRSGAGMVVDDCGCHGYCGLDWPDEAERLELARRPPRLSKNRFGWLDEWRSGDGHRLLSQHGDVRWP